MKLFSTLLMIILLKWMINVEGYPNFAVPSGQIGRFKNIFFPVDSWDDFTNELFSYSVFISPVTSIVTLDSTKDLCSGFKELKLNWNLTNPCEDYFCGQKEPFYLETYKNINLTTSERQDALITHHSLHRFCTLCDVNNSTENFNKTTCQFFNNQTCHINRCEPETICIPFYLQEVSNGRPFEVNKNSVCYDTRDNSFYYHADFTHKVIYWLYYRYVLLICLFLQIPLLLFSTFFILIPEIGVLFNKFFINKFTFKERFYAVLSLKNISFMVMYIASVINIVFTFIDVCGFFVLRLTSLWVGACAAFALFSFSIIVILWQHLLNQKSTVEQPYSLFIKIQLIVVFIFSIIFPFTISLSYLGGYFIDQQRRGFFVYAFSTVCAFISILYMILLVFLFFSSFRIFYKLYKNETLEEQTKSFFKEKFTLFVLLCLPPFSILCCYVLTFATQLMFGKDLLSLQIWILMAPGCNIIFLLVTATGAGYLIDKMSTSSKRRNYLDFIHQKYFLEREKLDIEYKEKLIKVKIVYQKFPDGQMIINSRIKKRHQHKLILLSINETIEIQTFQALGFIRYVVDDLISKRANQNFKVQPKTVIKKIYIFLIKK
eukprot:gene7909-12377_t